MSYATRKGLRIRKRYNEGVIRYRDWCRAHEPHGANSTCWMLWIEWVQARRDRMLSDRDVMLDEYKQQQRRRKSDARNTKRSHSAAASPAGGRDQPRELGS